MKWLRRWWAKVTHRHEWEVIFSNNLIVTDKFTGEEKAKHPLVIKRCHCGKEVAFEWMGDYFGWRPVDMDWLNFELAAKGYEVPARTHGLKP